MPARHKSDRRLASRQYLFMTVIDVSLRSEFARRTWVTAEAGVLA
jgi:hypothetical protein